MRFLIFSLLSLNLVAHAQMGEHFAEPTSTGTSTDVKPSATSKPSLRAIFHCAKALSGPTFARNEESLTAWSGTDGAEPFEPKAISILPPSTGTGQLPAEVLTINEHRVLVTPVVGHRSRRSDATHAMTLTLNLDGEISATNQLPIVDRRDPSHPAFAIEINYVRDAKLWLSTRRFVKSNPLTEIALAHAKTGEAAAKPMAQIIEALTQRLANAESVLKGETGYDASTRTTSPPTLRFMSQTDLNDLRAGLCACTDVLPNVNAVRDRLAGPQTLFEVRIQGKRQKLKREHLGCEGT